MFIKNVIKKYYFEITLVSPLLLFLLIFTLMPILRTLALSFQDATGLFTLSNYKELLLQEGFRQAGLNTVFVAFFSLILEVSLGMVLALLLCFNQRPQITFQRFLPSRLEDRRPDKCHDIAFDVLRLFWICFYVRAVRCRLVEYLKLAAHFPQFDPRQMQPATPSGRPGDRTILGRPDPDRGSGTGNRNTQSVGHAAGSAATGTGRRFANF